MNKKTVSKKASKISLVALQNAALAAMPVASALLIMAAVGGGGTRRRR